MQRLKGKIAMVTGASRGVGRGIALVLGEEGVTVYVTARSVRGAGASTRPSLPDTTIEDTAEQVAAQGGISIPVQCDHTVQAQVEALFERVKREQGHLDILVNNAWGGYEEEEGPHRDGRPFWEWSLGHWTKALTAGVWSTMVTSYLAMPLMLPQRQGLIANTTLAVGEYDGGWLFYYLPKHTINRITSGMAVDLREHHIAVVGISPGWTRTEAVMSGRPGHHPPVGDELKMTESAEYVGRAVVALATDPDLMSKTGTILHTRDLERKYGFKDIDGRDPLKSSFDAERPSSAGCDLRRAKPCPGIATHFTGYRF